MKCPGQDMKYWKANAIFDAQCPKCNTSVEFYKDDTSRRCGNCGHRFVNPKMDFGCASYCQYAEQCLGALPEEFSGVRDNLLKDKVAVAMKKFFQTDFKRIRQATATAQFAENITKAEGGNLAIILCAAYLHDTGVEAAREVLHKAGASGPMIHDICALLLDESAARDHDSLEAKILHDAVTLRQLQEAVKEGSLNGQSAQQKGETCLFTHWARSHVAHLNE